MKNCKVCGGKRWIALRDKSTGLQKTTKDGRLLYVCFRSNKHIQAEEYPFTPVEKRGTPGILYFDLEVSKSRYYSYGRKVNGEWLRSADLDKEYYIISWAASYLDSKKVFSGCVTQEQAQNWTDKEILQPLYDLLSSADLIAGHNVDAFDLKKINTRFLVNGIPPIMGLDGKKKKTLDSLKIARSNFAFEDNGLDALCKRFEIKGKDKITDDDWQRIVRTGDEKTLRKVDKYCKGDVKNGKELLKIFLPYSGKDITYGTLRALVEKKV